MSRMRQMSLNIHHFIIFRTSITCFGMWQLLGPPLITSNVSNVEKRAIIGFFDSRFTLNNLLLMAQTNNQLIMSINGVILGTRRVHTSKSIIFIFLLLSFLLCLQDDYDTHASTKWPICCKYFHLRELLFSSVCEWYSKLDFFLELSIKYNRNWSVK